MFALLLALVRAIPALEKIFQQVIIARAEEREREAANRLQAKDAAVDRALGLTAENAESAKK